LKKMRHVSPATALAIIALLVALAGTATAGSLALITSAQIQNGTIQLVDISSKAKRGLKGNRGPRGDTGQDGPAGAPGAAGPRGPAGVVPRLTTVLAKQENVQPGGIGQIEAVCPSGQRVISGGFIFGGITIVNMAVSGDRWQVAGQNDLSTPQNLTAIAYCAEGVSAATAGEHAAELKGEQQLAVQRRAGAVARE
jgi:hypothetical protein